MSKVEAWLKFEARRRPMLSREEERDLARRARAGDQKAVTCLVGSHLRLIIWVAERYGGPGSAKADLVQEGCVGLMQALHRFNPDKGARFSTYCIWWIKAAIQEHAMRSWSLVRIGTTSAQKTQFFDLRRLSAVLNETGDSLSDKGVCRVALMLRVSQRHVRRMEQRFVGPDYSLNDIGEPGNAEEWVNRLPDLAPTPDQRREERNNLRVRRGLLTAGLAELTKREVSVIRSRYLSSDVKKTLESVSKELGLLKERVRQIEVRAMTKLRAFILPKVDGLGAFWVYSPNMDMLVTILYGRHSVDFHSMADQQRVPT